MALQQLSVLRHLNMDFNSIPLDCANALTFALPSLVQLDFFSIARCRFQQGALAALSPGIAKLTSLCQLDVSDNSTYPILLHDLLCFLSSALQWGSHLFVLPLSGHPFQLENVKVTTSRHSVPV